MVSDNFINSNIERLYMDNKQNMPHNTNKDIESRAARVSSLLRTSATVWLEIAKEVYDAKLNLSSVGLTQKQL